VVVFEEEHHSVGYLLGPGYLPGQRERAEPILYFWGYQLRINRPGSNCVDEDVRGQVPGEVECEGYKAAL